ncbi:CocE/NonD family hydrolase [Paracoccus sp. CPCC 101403]|uniref:CocE/NonD family hydrolase n=1 Tax=Paracoccus broussonetiae TaxID=3075834 RepID=A0ABU3EIZ8_9RHOB|nr:CocE/NonD family hydrolase [Paracoccus sp. CPCC 101403]MDT1064227.1 CocE/NonD family hydrolase [Paracoccus sp. CPCC 101403]
MTIQERLQPQYSMVTGGIDVMVPMRDGTRLAIDIYRPDADGKFPALLSLGTHNKAMQSPRIWESCRNQPGDSAIAPPGARAGDSRFWASRGYVHVIGNIRGVGNSDDGDPARDGKMDAYDLVEWMAAQPWCDGNVGMTGMSSYGRQQMLAAKNPSPHLKAIFPYSPGHMLKNQVYPGGVLHCEHYQSIVSHVTGKAYKETELTAEEEELWEEAMADPDFQMYAHIYNIIERKGQHNKRFYSAMVNRYESEDYAKKLDELKDIKVPMYTGTGWYGYTYKTHLQGMFNYWRYITDNPNMKMVMTPLARDRRPWIGMNEELLRWFDYWLKGIDTGIMDEPPIKLFVNGANKYRYADQWPLKETKWTKLYLDSWEKLRWNEFIPGSNDGIEQPDAFLQMPLNLTSKVQKLRYVSDPLPEDMEVTGPISFHFWAEIDQDDANWIISIKDLGPDIAVERTKKTHPDWPNLFEQEITRGWLKASHRHVDQERSRTGQPFHPLTRSKHQKVTPGEVLKYDVEIMPTSTLFRKDHRIVVEISSMDVPSGGNGISANQSQPYHVCSSKTTVHKVYRGQTYPSHLLLPVIPDPIS